MATFKNSVLRLHLKVYVEYIAYNLQSMWLYFKNFSFFELQLICLCYLIILYTLKFFFFFLVQCVLLIHSYRVFCNAYFVEPVSLVSPALAGRFFTTSTIREAQKVRTQYLKGHVLLLFLRTRTSKMFLLLGDDVHFSLRHQECTLLAQ